MAGYKDIRRLSTVPLWACAVLQHSGRVHRPSLFQGVQWPDRASTLYLPERRRAWQEAFSTSRGELPHSLNIGWQVVSPRKLVCKYLVEGRWAAWWRSLVSHSWSTADLAMVLTWCLDGWWSSQSEGWGRSYWRQSCLIFQNHDLDEEQEEE